MAYPATPNWGRFGWAQKTVTLVAGTNTITFTKGTSFAELDQIQLYQPLANPRSARADGHPKSGQGARPSRIGWLLYRSAQRTCRDVPLREDQQHDGGIEESTAVAITGPQLCTSPLR